MTTSELEFMRLPSVLARRGISRSGHFRDVDVGRYPRPVKIGRCALWPRHEIDALMAAELNGATDEQMRSLADELVTQRKTLMPASLRAA